MHPIVLTPGEEAEYTLELDLSRQGMTRDWSFTAWGENGTVQVSIPTKGPSKTFPYIYRNDDYLPRTEGGPNHDENNANANSVALMAE